ncbi:MAG: TetR/AcrR family transcriptional regulator C-terminal domain-containing protein [Pseudomonadota bacterium]
MPNRTEKEEAIAEAAYALLEEKGYTGTSMLAIARRARASNETLYNWYGDKLGLFRALVTRNTEAIKTALETAAKPGASTAETLASLGPKLLEILLGPRAIALNRAAAGDATGSLGQALSGAGREVILPLIAEALEAGRSRGDLTFDTTEAAADLYISLLVGDLQIKRVTGARPPLTKPEREARATRALADFLTLTKPAA